MIASQYFNQPAALRDLRDVSSSGQSVQYLLTERLRSLLQGMSQYSLYNDPEAQALVGRVQDFTVGADGPGLKWDTADAEWNARAERLWERYFHEIGEGSIDCRRVHAGPYILRQVIYGWFMAGRSAAKICGTKDGQITPASGGLQMIDGQRIRNDVGRMDDDRHVAGVELDEYGAPVALSVADWVNAGMYLRLRTDTIRGGFIYLPNPLAGDFDMIAPPPALAVVVPSLVWMQQVMQSVVFATLKETALNAYVKRMPEGTSLADQASGNSAAAGDEAVGVRNDDRGGIEYAAGGPGLEYLEAGEDIVFGPSNYPSEALPTFLKEIQTRVAAANGITRQTLTGDWQGSNFTQARLELQFVGQRMRVLQRALEREFLLPVVRRAFVPSMILRGELPASLPDGWDRPTVTHQAMPEADPSKTAVRHLTELRGFDRTLSDIAREKGVDLMELIDDLSRDAAVFEVLGIPHPAGASVPSAGDGAGRAGGPEAGGDADGQGTDNQANTNEGGGGTPDE